MVLKLNDRETEIVRAALLGHVRELRAEVRALLGGYSPVGIEMCCERAIAEALLHRLVAPEPHYPAAMAP